MLLDKGIRISKISTLNGAELKEEITKYIEEGESISEQTDFYIQALVVAMLEVDEARFNNLFARAVNEKGFFKRNHRIYLPFLSKSGYDVGHGRSKPWSRTLY